MDYVKIVILVIAFGFILTGVLVQTAPEKVGNFLSSVEFFAEAWKTTTLFVILGLVVLAGYYFKFKDTGLFEFAEAKDSSSDANRPMELDL
jgi:hypothetical protein